MSENKHTPEPWRSEGLTILDADGHIIFRMDVSFYLPEERKEAARRITACVNACAGIDTELLEIIEDNDKTLAGVIANVEKQRDDLLEQVECSNITEKNMEGRLNKLIVQNAATKARLDEHRDGRLSALEKLAVAEKQRDELLAATEAIEINSEECLDFDECTAMLVSIDDYHRLMEAVARAKGEQ